MNDCSEREAHHEAPSPNAIHYTVLKRKMLKRNPTRIELKDVDEEFTNVERAQGGGTDNSMEQLR